MMFFYVISHMYRFKLWYRKNLSETNDDVPVKGMKPKTYSALLGTIYLQKLLSFPSASSKPDLHSPGKKILLLSELPYD